MVIVRLAFAAIFFACATGAKADTPWSAGDLVCSGGMALARFTTGYNEDFPEYEKLPEEFDRAKLSSAPGSDRRDCTLPNGWEVRLRMGAGQGFPYGMGGGALPEYFSLWLNHRKVISRMTWLEGYEQSFGDRNQIVGVLFTGNDITICKRSAGTIKCERNSIVVATIAPDQVEYPPPGIVMPKPGTIKVVRGQRNRLCRSLVRTSKPGEISTPGAIGGFPFGARPVNVREVDWIDPSPMKAIDTLAWAPLNNGRVGQLDLDGDRRPETVINFEGFSHYFDGSYWIAIEHGLPLSAVHDEIFPPEKERDAEKATAGSTGKRWHVYSGGTVQLYPDVTSRYVHLDGYTYRGAVYFLVHPTLLTNDPTAILVRPKTKGRMETVCRFQAVRPNF